MMFLLFLCLCISQATAQLAQQLSEGNFWVTWANRTGNSAFCLHLSAATDPFKTCLIGLPVYPPNYYNCSRSGNNSHCLAMWIKSLNKTLPWNPQEINLLDSRKANNSGCVYFGHWNLTGIKKPIWLTPKKNYNDVAHCGSPPYGWDSGNIQLQFNKSMALPPTLYLICGDRAWQGIPRFAHGGPCYIGKLNIWAPSKKFLTSLQLSQTRFTRDIRTLPNDCDDEVELWSATARFFAALISNIGTAHALSQIKHLACWSAKQANVTTEVISQLAQDMSSLRQAVIQNRAAIDYLLLAQGKGCEDVQGMCCFNLSDHSQSIHNQLQWLHAHTQKITIGHNPLDDWLMSFGISAWLKDGIKIGVIILMIVLVVLCMGPCILQCFSFQIRRMANVVFDKRGGDAGGLTGAITLQPVYKGITK